MMKRMSWLAGVLIAAAALAFLMLGTALAQEEPGEPPPPPCRPGETCVEPVPPCPIEGPCEGFDADDDGFFDGDEEAFGSDPNDANSTPEHAFFPDTCRDGRDNDLDGVHDLRDDGCTIDSDGDGRPDITDNCPWDPNADQADRDGDGQGDLCDYDVDNDGWVDDEEAYLGSDPDNAASTPEHAYYPDTCADGTDNDLDGTIDMADDGCTIDSDEDGHPDLADNCPWDPNPDQADSDGDGIGNPCDYDADNDGWDDYTEDLAGSNPNDPASTPEHSVFRDTCTDSADNDRDGLADDADPTCAPDQDGDFVPDGTDNCSTVWNEDQADSDADGVGDACEDSDGDGYFDLDEESFGSDPNDSSSAPEHAVFFETCQDGVDNDRDGQVDGEDPGCEEMVEIYLQASPGADRDESGATGPPKQPLPAALPSAGAGPAVDAGGDSLARLVRAFGTAAVAMGGAVLLGAVYVARRRVTS